MSNAYFVGQYCNPRVPHPFNSMSLLLSTPTGAAVPTPSTLYGSWPPSNNLFPGTTAWTPVPVAAGLMSNVYSPVTPNFGGVDAPQPVYVNNGTISAGPWTSNSVRAFNVITDGTAGVVPPACMTPYPQQYMPTVMGSLSKMSAVVPPIGLQNSWWPVETVSYVPSYMNQSYAPWSRPLVTAYVPYRPTYGFGV